MKFFFVIVVGCTCILGSAFPQTSSVEGVVTLPMETREAATPTRYAAGVNPTKPEGPAAIVYLEGAPSTINSNPPTLKLLQQGFQFLPRLLAVQKGTAVEFPNFDDGY